MGGDRYADIADAGRAPSAAFSEPLDAQAGDFSMRAALLPSVDASRAQCKALIGVETSGDHREDTEGYCVEDDVGIAGRADADA